MAELILNLLNQVEFIKARDQFAVKKVLTFITTLSLINLIIHSKIISRNSYLDG